MSGGIVIRFSNASVAYPGGARALRGVDVEVADGEFVVVVGLSGAGKSTLLRTVNGLVPLTGGSIEVNGRRVDTASRRELRRLRAEIGMIFQSFNLVTRASVLHNVLMGRLHATPTVLSVLGLHLPAARELAMRALERVELAELASVRAATLSGGQQQRVGIARALAQEPRVMLADEPVASLDPPTATRVMEYLRQISRELGITTIVNLHYLDLARRYGDRILGMRDGKVVFDGARDRVDDHVFEAIYGRPLTGDDVLETPDRR